MQDINKKKSLLNLLKISNLKAKQTELTLKKTKTINIKYTKQTILNLSIKKNKTTGNYNEKDLINSDEDSDQDHDESEIDDYIEKPKI